MNLLQMLLFSIMPYIASPQFSNFPAIGNPPVTPPINTIPGQFPGTFNPQSNNIYPQNPNMFPQNPNFNPQNPNFNPQNPMANGQGQVNANTVAFMLTNGNSNSGTQPSRGLPFTYQTLRANAYVTLGTGLLIVTVPGIYLLTLSAQATSNSACQIALQRDNDVIMSFTAQLNSMSSQSIIVQLNARQSVYPATIGACTNVNFGGYLVAPIMGGYQQQQPTRPSPFPGQFPGGRFRSYG